MGGSGETVGHIDKNGALMKYVTPRYENLTRIARERHVKSMLEIGTWQGLTAENFLATALQYASETIVRYVGIDLFDLLTPELKKKEHSKPMAKIDDVWRRLSRFSDCGGIKVVLHQGFSHDVLPTMPAEEFGLIYIDGGHRADTIAQDWSDVQRFIGPNTVMVFDDYRHNHPGVGCKELIDGLDREQWDIEILEPTEEFQFGKMNFAQVTRR